MTYQPPQWQPGQQPQYQQAPAPYQQPMHQAPPMHTPQPYQQAPHPPAPYPPHPQQPPVYTGPIPNPRSQTVTQNRLAFILGSIFTIGIVGFVVVYNVFVV